MSLGRTGNLLHQGQACPLGLFVSLKLLNRSPVPPPSKSITQCPPVPSATVDAAGREVISSVPAHQSTLSVGPSRILSPVDEPCDGMSPGGSLAGVNPLSQQETLGQSPEGVCFSSTLPQEQKGSHRQQITQQVQLGSKKILLIKAGMGQASRPEDIQAPGQQGSPTSFLPGQPRPHQAAHQ